MPNYDISHLPQPVHDAVLHLTEALVEAFPPPTEARAHVPRRRPQHAPSTTRVYLRGQAMAPTRHTPPPADAVSGADAPPGPTRMRCPHGTEATPCCPDCTTLYRAEAVLVDAQTEEPARFPRSVIELRILEALQQMAPLPVTPRQIAMMLGLPLEQTRVSLQALSILEAVHHPTRGYYRHRPAVPLPCGPSMPEAVGATPARGRAGTDQNATPPTDPLGRLEALEQQALAFVRAAFPRPVTPNDLWEQLRMPEGRPVLRTLCRRGQVECVSHDAYRYLGRE